MSQRALFSARDKMLNAGWWVVHLSMDKTGRVCSFLMCHEKTGKRVILNAENLNDVAELTTTAPGEPA